MKHIAPLLVALAAASFAHAQASDAAKDPSSREYWDERISAAQPAATDTLYVLVHLSKDCGYCRHWKKDPGGLAVANKLVDVFPNLRFFIVERNSLGEDERATQYPPELAFEYERRAAIHDGLSQGVPQFEIFLSRKLVYRGSGLDKWSERIVPAIIGIEKRREKPAAPTP